MEGRRAPPRATHPFPNNPDLSKFWNTPFAKAWFKSLGVFVLCYGSILLAHCYVTRNIKGPFGVDMSMTREQRVKKFQILQGISEVFPVNLKIHYKHQEFGKMLDPDIRFNDETYFVAPKVDDDS